ncbi:MAG: MBL fold metallo-hydrolase [Candidatus Methanoplasma sp.]|jgi:glyoxylase-like metal-dependent hydrolase (beta-lactamase superfamily II)|nr:MBL fold metallo-hydrolase [Candidatus Methanoplasma sp.]
MIQLDVLAVGSLRRDCEGRITDVHSSSVLIRADGRMIVADTSTEYMRPAIKTAFRQIGVFPKDVDTVILTHSHRDHAENNDMFGNAEILMHPDEYGNIKHAKPIGVGSDIVPGVRVVHTPGHTAGSISIFVEADRRYVIAGDAIPRYTNYEKMVPPAVNTDPVLAMESIKLITKYADIIIPGHDPPFPVER